MNKRHIKHTKPVDSAQVRSALISLLIDTLPLDLEARALDEETLWDILLYASFHQTTIEAACLELGVSSGTTTRNHLTKELGDSPSDLLALERQRNQALRTQLPRSFRKHLNRRRYDVALDLVELPYYGKPHRHPQEVRRGPAKAGTTYFHAYATLAIVHDNQRYELALTFVWAKESLTEVVLRLLKYVRRLGLRIRWAYCDGVATKASRASRSFGFCDAIAFRMSFRSRCADKDSKRCATDNAAIRPAIPSTRGPRTHTPPTLSWCGGIAPGGAEGMAWIGWCMRSIGSVGASRIRCINSTVGDLESKAAIGRCIKCGPAPPRVILACGFSWLDWRCSF